MPANKRRLALFVDTNVWLHFPPAKDIDWLVVAADERVELVVCGQVLDELDAKKYDHRLADRAARALREIRAASKAGGELRPGVTLLVEPDVPEPRRESADENIIRAAQTYGETGMATDVAVVTDDLGMELRCQSRGVRCVSMPSELRLPVPRDEAARRHAKVVEELAALKGRLPDLTIRARAWQSESALSGVCSVVLTPAQALDVEAELGDERRRAPRLGGAGLPAAAFALGLSEDTVRSYNEALEQYHERYRGYLRLRNAWLEAQSRTALLELVVENCGRGPAEDVVARLLWPEGIAAIDVELADDHDLHEAFQEPPRPRPPKKPRSMLESLTMPDHIRDLRNWTPDIQPLAVQNASAVVTGRRAATINIRKLNHHHQESLGRCAMRFRDWPAVRPFEILYTVTTASHPERFEGKVAVRVTRGLDGE